MMFKFSISKITVIRELMKPNVVKLQHFTRSKVLSEAKYLY